MASDTDEDWNAAAICQALACPGCCDCRDNNSGLDWDGKNDGEPEHTLELHEPIDAEDYMNVLLARQAAYEAEHPSRGWVRPLLEWFVKPGDERWVRLPESAPTAPKRQPKPRVYRSADSIRAELANVEAQMARVAGDDCEDGAVVNLSPYSRSRAARNAGRRRFEKLDRDLERYTNLKAKRDRLAGQLARAEAREAQQSATDSRTADTHPETPHGCDWACTNPFCHNDTAHAHPGNCPHCDETLHLIGPDGHEVTQ